MSTMDKSRHSTTRILFGKIEVIQKKQLKESQVVASGGWDQGGPILLSDNISLVMLLDFSYV